MSRVDLLLLEDLHQSTTPGPWYQFGLPWFQDELGVLAGSDDPHVATFIADLTPMESLDDDGGGYAHNPADARFMVEAHRLLPALISELRAAREALEACRPVLARHGGLIRDNGGDDWDPEYRYEVAPPPHVLAARESLAVYDQAVGP